MATKIDLQGLRFGRLLVSDQATNDNQGKIQWSCLCDCGNTKVVRAKFLRNRDTQSCGCLHKDIARRIASKNFTKHYKSNHPIYRIWIGMKQRCLNPKSSVYKYYGGRGIKIYSSWINSFTVFLGDMLSSWKPGLSLDRIDVNGNYELSNCRWITQKEQANNRTSNRRLAYNNETHTISEWSDKLSIKSNTIISRLNMGWSVERTLSKKICELNE